MSLLDSKTGGTYTVLRIELERDVSRRLQALGFTQGTRVSVLNRKKSGSVIIYVRGTRFAVGKQIAEGILVKGSE